MSEENLGNLSDDLGDSFQSDEPSKIELSQKVDIFLFLQSFTFKFILENILFMSKNLLNFCAFLGLGTEPITDCRSWAGLLCCINVQSGY